MTPLPFLTRPANAADLAFVWDALSKQLARREHARWAPQPDYGLPSELVTRRERTFARYLLGESHCLVATPTDPGQAELVCGFVIFDPLIRTVHYAYTGRNLRRLGIARHLILSATHGWEVTHVSHLTKAGRGLVAGCHLRVRYDPYRAFFARDTFLRTHGAAGNGSIKATTAELRPELGDDRAEAREG